MSPKKQQQISEEKIDYLTEMMNIAAGNAVAAFSQLLNCEVDIKLPKIFIVRPSGVSAIFKDPSVPLLCVSMDMLGDVTGKLFFVVPDEQKKDIVNLAKKALPPVLRKRLSLEVSVLEEIGNIVAGVYMTAIHDFSKLNVYHSVPMLSIDTIQSLIDRAVSDISDAYDALVIESEFFITDGNVRTIFIVIPGSESIDAIFGSMGEAWRGLTGEK